MIYTASKLRHAPKWREMRAEGWPINSTWIDRVEAPPSEFADIWEHCIKEASTAQVLVLYREPDEILKGAFVEIGAALSHGVPVFASGCNDLSFIQHPLVTICYGVADIKNLLRLKGFRT